MDPDRSLSVTFTEQRAVVFSVMRAGRVETRMPLNDDPRLLCLANQIARKVEEFAVVLLCEGPRPDDVARSGLTASVLVSSKALSAPPTTTPAGRVVQSTRRSDPSTPRRARDVKSSTSEDSQEVFPLEL